MSRLFLRRARALGSLLAALAVVGMSPTTALAGAGTSRPVVDAWPRTVMYRREAVVKAHMTEGRSGDRVLIQKKDPSGDWQTRDLGQLNSDRRVTFRLPHLKRTGWYRLVWHSGDSSAHARSDLFRIKVRPRLTLRPSPKHVMVSRGLVVEGTLRPAIPGRKVYLHRKVNGHWRFIKGVGAGDGRFSFSIAGRDVGHHVVRATFSGDSKNAPRRVRSGYNVYDPDAATWYGPGFYGNRTACGKTLHEDTLGVANRSLPCGTKVSILYHGRTITVPVIDRGPYTSADWDLTSATARRLGFEGSNTIGVRH